jgi:hypothetical protein
MRCYDDSFSRYAAPRYEYVRYCRQVLGVEPPSSLLLDEMFGPNPMVRG